MPLVVKRRPAYNIKIGNVEKKVYFFDEIFDFSKIGKKQRL